MASSYLPELPNTKPKTPSLWVFWLTILATVALGGVIGCTSAERGKLASYGSSHKVQLYSGGELVREWTSSGKVCNETQSDGFFFTEKGTGAHVRVTGDVVVIRE